MSFTSDIAAAEAAQLEASRSSLAAYNDTMPWASRDRADQMRQARDLYEERLAQGISLPLFNAAATRESLIADYGVAPGDPRLDAFLSERGIGIADDEDIRLAEARTQAQRTANEAAARNLRHSEKRVADAVAEILAEVAGEGVTIVSTFARGVDGPPSSGELPLVLVRQPTPAAYMTGRDIGLMRGEVEITLFSEDFSTFSLRSSAPTIAEALSAAGMSVNLSPVRRDPEGVERMTIRVGHLSINEAPVIGNPDPDPNASTLGTNLARSIAVALSVAHNAHATSSKVAGLTRFDSAACSIACTEAIVPPYDEWEDVEWEDGDQWPGTVYEFDVSGSLVLAVFQAPNNNTVADIIEAAAEAQAGKVAAQLGLVDDLDVDIEEISAEDALVALRSERTAPLVCYAAAFTGHVAAAAWGSVEWHGDPRPRWAADTVEVEEED